MAITSMDEEDFRDGNTPAMTADTDMATGEDYSDRVKTDHGYQIDKYMQPQVKPIHMPRMQPFKRAEADDPG